MPFWYDSTMENHRIYKTAFARVYPLYIAKAERKGRTKAELDQIIVGISLTSCPRWCKQSISIPIIK